MASEVLLINPRRKRRARRTTKRRSTRRRATHRRRAVLTNPRRKRRVGVRRARRHVSRRRRRNPMIGGGLMHTVTQGAAIAGGVITTTFVADWLQSKMPKDFAPGGTSGDLGRIGLKAAIGIGLPMIAGKFLPRGLRNGLALGGVAAVALDLFVTYVAPHIGDKGATMRGLEVGQLNGLEVGALNGYNYDEESAYGGGAY